MPSKIVFLLKSPYNTDLIIQNFGLKSEGALSVYIANRWAYNLVICQPRRAYN